MTAQRTDIAAALHTLVTGAWQWAYNGQRLQTWDDCPAQPAIYTLVADEEHHRQRGMPAISDLEFSLVVYSDYGKDPSVERPASTVDNILEAILGALEAGDPSGRQTLGNTVQDCWVEGRITRDNGDLDGQAMLVIPVRVKIP